MKNTRKNDMQKIKIIHETFKEFIPYSLQELIQGFEKVDHVNQQLDLWWQVKETYEALIVKRNYSTAYERKDALSTAMREVNKQNIGENLRSIFKEVRKKRFQDFLEERKQGHSFELREVECSLLRSKAERAYKALSKIDQSTFSITLSTPDYEPIKKLRDGSILDTFTASFMGVGVIISNKYFLIEPLFENIIYYHAHNVFCGLIVDQDDDQNSIRDIGNLMYHKYYFDNTGFFILKDYGEYQTRPLPAIGVNYYKPKGSEMVRIDSKLIGLHYGKEFSPSYFTIGHQHSQESGLIDNNNNEILPKEYGEIVVFEEEKTIIAEKDNEVHLINLTNRALIKTLDCNKIFDNFFYLNPVEKLPFLRAAKYIETEQGRLMKWGIIDANGNEVQAMKFDYIDETSNPNYFRIFLVQNPQEDKFGIMEAEEFSYGNSEEAEEWFIDYESDAFNSSVHVVSSWRGNHLGLVDSNRNIIIPPNYSWMEFLSPDLLVVNINGEVINYFDKDSFGEGDNVEILGGKEGVINLKNEIIVPFEYDVILKNKDEIFAQKTTSNHFNKNEPYDIYDLNKLLNGNKIT